MVDFFCRIMAASDFCDDRKCDIISLLKNLIEPSFLCSSSVYQGNFIIRSWLYSRNLFQGEKSIVTQIPIILIYERNLEKS